MSNKLRILVTDGNYKHSLGIVRSLGMQGYEVYVLNNSKTCIAGLSSYCEKTLVTCDWNNQSNEQQYISQVKKYCIEYGISLIIPVGFKNCTLMAKYKEELLEVTHLVITDYEKMDFALDKSKVLTLAKEQGVGVPLTFYPKSLSELSLISDKLAYPCVIKSRFEHGANVVTYPQNAEQLETMYSEIVKKHGFDDENLPMVQEYLTGDGYAFFALYIEGQCKQIFMHHRLREFPVTGGASVKAEAFYDVKLLISGKKLLDALEWHGVAMVEFKKDSSGNYKLMEINPKYWGSTDLALAAGAVFPFITAQYVSGTNIEYCETYERKVQFHWPCDGDWLHAIYRPEHFLGVLIDCFNPKVKSNWWWKEYRVNLFLLRNLVAGVMKALLRR